MLNYETYENKSNICVEKTVVMKGLMGSSAARDRHLMSSGTSTILRDGGGQSVQTGYMAQMVATR